MLLDMDQELRDQDQESRDQEQELWTAVDRYLVASLVPGDEATEAAARANAEAGLPAIDVTPVQGRFLYLLALIHRAKRILEVGTLGGYSTIWLGKALPAGGRLVTLEVNPKHAQAAAANLARAGLSDMIDLRVGPALQSLAELQHEGAAPFDMIFIDADKANNPAYFEWALRLSRVGTVIVVDNVVRDGAIIDSDDEDAAVRGTRRFIEMLGAEPRVEATAIQTVGSKGYDGFALAVVVRE